MRYIFLLMFSLFAPYTFADRDSSLQQQTESLSIYKMAPVKDDRLFSNETTSSPLTSTETYSSHTPQKYSKKDLKCLTQAVYYEARGEKAKGGTAVAEVVLNRTAHAKFPNTICGVVTQKYKNICQFSFVCNGSMKKKINQTAWAYSKNIAKKVLEKRAKVASHGALFFHADYVKPRWAKHMALTAHIGTHKFYKHK